jgi:hypothetical protein
MIDDELIALLRELSYTRPRSRERIDASRAVAAKLESEPEFRRNYLIRNQHGSHSLLPTFVAQTMLQYTHIGGDPARIVAWFRRIPELILRPGKGGAVKALYGVDCTQGVPLSDDIELIPFEKLGPSSTRDWLLEVHERGFEMPSPQGFIFPPRAALYRPGTIEKLTVEQAEDFATSPPSVWFRDLDVAASLLALTPRAVPLEAAHWYYYEDPDIARLCEFGHGTQGYEFFQPMRFIEPPEVTAESMAGLLTGYRKLNKDDQDRIMLALQRLIRSRSQLIPGNRAIDLSIVLEVLFMNADSGEHTHKIGVRVARLVGLSLDERRTVFDQASRLYAMRSSMVHRGSASGPWKVNGNKVNAQELVESVDLLCVESIRRLIDRGGIPTHDEWRDNELGA